MDSNTKRLNSLNWQLHALGVLPLLVGGAAYYYAVHAPLHEKRESAARRAAVLEQFLQQGPAVARQYAEASALIKETRQRAEIVRQQIPEDPREADFMRQVNDAAEQEGVVIRNYTHGKVTKSASYSEMEVQLNCEGRYAQICEFLDRIANAPRAATVSRMHITAAPAAETYPVQLTLGLYFGLPEKSAPGSRNIED